ncbi:hypothetical protein CCAX7_001680 [Capsulimonas corticalis]|uniref:Uncharacterized protein n=1 Tax=Capsulimonas corticalis TaxID=2219043 RepID=A0A402CRQ0_9BACT|nr:TlpA disulfide reductase family protein [Capsulimonas corticalis]BDI28117.1 hypothetical protein CCAX7_001680 [Capsulimonas corticalis]
MSKLHQKERPLELCLAASGIVFVLAAPALAASPVSLADAKTIQVHETMLSKDRDGGLFSSYEIDLRIARPDRVNALFSSSVLKTPNQYTADGKTEREYRAKYNTIRTLDPPKNGLSNSAFRRMAKVDLILNDGKLPAPEPGVQRSVAAETLDNIPMTVTTDILPAFKDHNGEEVIDTQKFWVVTATGLPYRYVMSETTQGKTSPLTEETFTGWRFNQLLTPTQMAFAAPADAKPYVEMAMPTMTSLPVGAIAPDFAAVTPDGKTVRLSDFQGKIVVLDFWATWCHPCQEALPHLESVYKQIQGQDVAVLGVCVWDKKESYDKWVADKKEIYSFPTAFDPAGRGDNEIAGTLYKVNGIPTQYVIDKQGKVAAVMIGYDGADDHHLEDALAAQGVKLPAGAKAAAYRLKHQPLQ